MKLQKWFWGSFFLVAGAVILASGMGYLEGINLLTLALTILLIPIIIKSIRPLNFSGILIPLAVIGILYAEPLGITDLTPWPILLTSVFLSIGLSIIFYSSKRSWCHTHHGEHFDTIINEGDSSVVEVIVNFGSSIKYVNADDFKKGTFRCSFGALKVYFDNATVSPEGAEILLDVSFAGVELYIPKEWHVVSDISANFGGVDEKNRSIGTDGPTVTLRGNISLAGIEIIYI